MYIYSPSVTSHPSLLVDAYSVYFHQSPVSAVTSDSLTVYTYISREIDYSQHVYSGSSLIRTPLGQTKVSLIERCPYSGCPYRVVPLYT